MRNGQASMRWSRAAAIGQEQRDRPDDMVEPTSGPVVILADDAERRARTVTGW